MPRSKPGSSATAKRRRLRNRAKGYFLGRSKLRRTMAHAVVRGEVYAYRDRRQVKRNYRALWITRVTAACRARSISYSRFMAGLRRASVSLNRKMLSELAIHDPAAFDKLVEIARSNAASAAA